MQNKSNTKIVTIAIFLTTFMTAIEGTIVSTAMPTIVSDLNGSQWIAVPEQGHYETVTVQEAWDEQVVNSG